MDKNDWKIRIKVFWEKYEAKIVLVFGLVLAVVISFEAGSLKGAGLSQKPLVIEKPAASQDFVPKDPAQAQNLTTSAPVDQTGVLQLPQNCAYLGSKNSNKYHLPTCRFAKNIKPENRVCFSSPDEAQSKGYLPDKGCVK